MLIITISHKEKDELLDSVVSHRADFNDGFLKLHPSGDDAKVVTHCVEYQESPLVENTSKNMVKTLMLNTQKCSDPNQNALSQSHVSSPVDNPTSSSSEQKIINTVESSCQNIIEEDPVSSTMDNPAQRESNNARACKSVIVDILNKPENVGKKIIFLTHSYQDYERASRLASELRKHGFIVLVQGDEEVERFLKQNSSYYCRHIVQQVHFIIPVISNQYLRDISVSDDATFFNDPHSNHRGHVQLIFRNYQNNLEMQQCFNYKIEPYVLNEVDKQDVRSYLEFKFFYNENHFNRMINVMKA